MTTERLLRLTEVREMTAASTASIYRWVARGDFPAPLKLGKQAVRWRLTEIEEWIDGLERTS